MSKMRFKLNKSGVKELLKSDAMKAVCREHAAGIQQRCGPGYVVEDRNYPERSGAAVRVDSYEAYRDNLDNNTLLKAVR